MSTEYPGNITCAKLVIETLGQCIELCSNQTIKTLERSHWHSSGVFTIHFWQLVSIADFKQAIKKLINFNYRLRFTVVTLPKKVSFGQNFDFFFLAYR